MWVCGCGCEGVGVGEGVGVDVSGGYEQGSYEERQKHTTKARLWVKRQ